MKTITVGAYEAKTHLARLLSKVAKGDQVIITKHEKPVARLSPFETTPRPSRAEVLNRLDELAKHWRAGPESSKDLINAGRRI